MSRKRKSKQKIVGSIIGIIVLAILSIFGLHQENINELLGLYENNSQSQKENVVSSIPVEGNLNIYFIDVGQADSILIVNDDSSMLIDAGNNEDGEDVFNNFNITYVYGKLEMI